MIPGNFLRIGDRIINLNLVAHVNLYHEQKMPEPGGVGSVCVTFAVPDGEGAWEPIFYGKEAEQLRAYFGGGDKAEGNSDG